MRIPGKLVCIPEGCQKATTWRRSRFVLKLAEWKKLVIFLPGERHKSTVAVGMSELFHPLAEFMVKQPVQTAYLNILVSVKP